MTYTSVSICATVTVSECSCATDIASFARGVTNSYFNPLSDDFSAKVMCQQPAQVFINKTSSNVLWIVCAPGDNHWTWFILVVTYCDCANIPPSDEERTHWNYKFGGYYSLLVKYFLLPYGWKVALGLQNSDDLSDWWQSQAISAVINHLSLQTALCISSFSCFSFSPQLPSALFHPEPVLCHQSTLSFLWVFLMPVMHIYVFLSESAPETMAQEGWFTCLDLDILGALPRDL